MIGEMIFRCERVLVAAGEAPRDDVAIITQGGVITNIISGLAAAEMYAGVEVEPMPGLTTPGLIDAHSHLRSTTLDAHDLRGKDLEEVLIRMSAMSTVDAEADAFVAACDLLLAGVTSVQVMYHCFADPDGYLSGLKAMLRGLDRAGLRAVVILGITDGREYISDLMGHPTGALAAYVEPRRGIVPDVFPDVVAEAQLSCGIGSASLVTLGVGPVAPQWCSDHLLGVVGGIAEQGLRVHTHALESPRQRSWTGPDPIERLIRAGLLGPTTSLAHGVWCTEDDLSRLAVSGAQLVHCPESNAKLGAGKARVHEWIAAGITTGMGMDSVHPAHLPRPLHEARAAFGSDALAVEALTIGGATCLGHERQTGVIEPGRRADLVAWHDGDEGCPATVVVEGRVRVREGRHLKSMDYESARHAVETDMAEDSSARAKRHYALDGIMTGYAALLDRHDDETASRR